MKTLILSLLLVSLSTISTAFDETETGDLPSYFPYCSIESSNNKYEGQLNRFRVCNATIKALNDAGLNIVDQYEIIISLGNRDGNSLTLDSIRLFKKKRLSLSFSGELTQHKGHNYVDIFTPDNELVEPNAFTNCFIISNDSRFEKIYNQQMLCKALKESIRKQDYDLDNITRIDITTGSSTTHSMILPKIKLKTIDGNSKFLSGIYHAGRHYNYVNSIRILPQRDDDYQNHR